MYTYMYLLIFSWEYMYNCYGGFAQYLVLRKPQLNDAPYVLNFIVRIFLVLLPPQEIRGVLAM